MKERILVIGAGKFQRIPGAMHHDRINFPGIDIRFDLDGDWFYNNHKLTEYRNYFERIVCIHVVEHLKSLLNFMDQAHELLKEGGVLEIETPNAGVNYDLTHCDPTHIRCYRKATFTNYFTPKGIEKFGYTNKAWEILELYTFRTEITDDTIRAVMKPIK